MTSTRPARTPRPAARGHVAVVGAGIVGLGAAAEAHRRGYRVTVVEQASSVVGSSVQNFGHLCVTAQVGTAREYALASRERWLSLGSAAGFRVAQAGAHVVARTDAELQLLAELAAERAVEHRGEHAGGNGRHGREHGGEVRLLDAVEASATLPVRPGPVVGGAHLPLDLQVDPRVAAPALAAWLERQGVTFRWRTATRAVGTGRVETTAGPIDADAIVVATHHDLDRLLPELATAADVRRCRLHMLRVSPAVPLDLPGPLLTGWSMVRYAAFAACPSASDVARELAAADPEAAAWDVNLMLTPQADGTLIAGDTHVRAVDAPVFQDEAGYAVLLRLLTDLLGVDLDVVERWQGTYATASDREFLVAEPDPGVHVATVTTGIGMTTGFGLAADVLDRAGLTA